MVWLHVTRSVKASPSFSVIKSFRCFVNYTSVPLKQDTTTLKLKDKRERKYESGNHSSDRLKQRTAVNGKDKEDSSDPLKLNTTTYKREFERADYSSDQLKQDAITVNWKDKREYERFGHDMWRPKKRLTRYQMDHLRELHRDYPGEWTLTKLSKKFFISHSAVKRILKSKFEPSDEVRNRQDKKALERKQTRRKDLLVNRKFELK